VAGFSPKIPLSFSTEGSYTLNKTINEMVLANLKNLILTNPGERIMDPNFGVGIKKFLFEQNVSVTYEEIKFKIAEQTGKYMPFVQLNELDIQSDPELDYLIHISIEFEILPLAASEILNLQIQP
jgi:phage baseplate assembly protein W